MTKKQKRWILAGLVCILAAVLWFVTVPVKVDVSTGLAANGALLSKEGSLDAHWMVPQLQNGKDGALVPAHVVADDSQDHYGDWLDDGPKSDWIARTAKHADDNGPAPYTFSRPLSLWGFVRPTLEVDGKWAIDDAGTLNLNGHQLAVIQPCNGCNVSSNWNHFHPFAATVADFNPAGDVLSMTITYSDEYCEGVRLEGELTGRERLFAYLIRLL